MDELFAKSIRVLELPRILELLTAEAVSEEAKERAAGLTPTPYYAEAVRLHGETPHFKALGDLKAEYVAETVIRRYTFTEGEQK